MLWAALAVGSGSWTQALAQDAPAPDAGVVAPPGAGAAPGASVSFNDDFELRYWRLDQRLPDPDDVPVFDYIEQVNRFNANAAAGHFTFAAQLDEVTLWLDRYYLDDVLFLERDLTTEGLPNVFGNGAVGDTAYATLEKVRGTVEGDWGSLSLGDSYVAFGRGIALNLNRNVDIDIDTSVQGAKAVLRPGAWDITLVAGQANKQQVAQDNPNIGIQGDRRHLIAGARVERFGLGPANLGVHGVVYDFVNDPGFAASVQELEPFDAVVGGATAELIGVGGADIFVEGDVFGYGKNQPSPLGPDAPDVGYAAYGSVAVYPKPFVVLLELKRYDQAERVNATLGPELYEVAVAPTLEYERVTTEDSSATLNSNDVAGARLQIDWTAVPQHLVPYVAVATFRDWDLGGLHFNRAPETIVHPTAGLEWIDGELAMLLNVGYRVDLRDAGFGADRQAHGDLSFNFPLPDKLSASIAAQVESYRWGVNALQQRDYFEAETGYTLAYGSALAATVFLDGTTNPLVPTTGNVTDAVYIAAELQVKPAKAWTLKAFYGAQKAGIRCSGGQCRQLPGFDGGRLSVVGTF